MNALNVTTFRRRLHELFHPGMSFIPGCLVSHPGTTFISVSGHLPLSVYMIWSKNVFAPGWFHPGPENRDEIIPERTRFCSKSCKHLQVNDQTPRWKSSRDEMKVIPGWNSSRDEITHVNGALLSVSLFTVVVFSRWTLFIVKHKNLDLSSEASNFFTVASLPYQHNW